MKGACARPRSAARGPRGDRHRFALLPVNGRSFFREREDLAGNLDALVRRAAPIVRSSEMPTLARSPSATGRGRHAFASCESAMARSRNLWFAETLENKIARITTTGLVTELPIPFPDTQPVGVAAAPDGHVWFAESAAATGNRIGRLFVR